MTKNEDISNPFEVTERKRLAVQNNVDKNKYLTIIFFSQHYTQLDSDPTFHPYYVIVFGVMIDTDLCDASNVMAWRLHCWLSSGQKATSNRK